MESVKKENERILRAQEELNQILIERFHTEGKGKRDDSEDISYQHKHKKTKQKMKVAHLPKYLVINVILIILVTVVRITTILGKENINLMKKSLGSSKRSSRQHLMEKLKRMKKHNLGYPG